MYIVLRVDCIFKLDTFLHRQKQMVDILCISTLYQIQSFSVSKVHNLQLLFLNCVNLIFNLIEYPVKIKKISGTNQTFFLVLICNKY